MKDLGYYNGKYDEIDKMTIPMNDRAHFFGDGVYDATYCRNYIIWNLQEHLDRLYNSARLLEIEPPCTKAEMAELLKEMVKKVDTGNQFVYWQISRGTADRVHAFPKGVKSNLWITLRPRNVADTYQPVRVVTTEDTRFLHCNIKTLNLLPSVIYTQRAEEAGCDEAILHRGDRVTECSHSNVHIIKDGTLITAPCDNLILPGITRAHILRICERLGIPVEERPFTVGEMMAADEVFFSSSSALTCRIREIDGKAVGMRDEGTFGRIRDAYQAEMKAECGVK